METPADETEGPGPEEQAGAPTPEHKLGRRVVVMYSGGGRKPDESIGDDEATAIWAAVSAPWHPKLLARLGALPEIEDSEDPSEPKPGEIRLLPGDSFDRLDEGFRARASDAGVALLKAEPGDADRLGVVRRLAVALGVDAAELETIAEDTAARDFMALGSARWWLKDLTAGMEHADLLDVDSLTREATSGAQAWEAGDAAGATNRLRACFELLTEARERFYPVDAFLVDLYLLDERTEPEAIQDAFEARVPFTLIATAKAVETLANRDPEAVARLRTAIEEGWADVVGGPYIETAEPLRPLESNVWQFREGSRVYRAHLDDRTVETLAGRRFALDPHRPRLAKRFGFRFALHFAFDAGGFPKSRESKRLWEAPDGSSLEALTRSPLAADRPNRGLRIAWDMAATMRDDHVATVGLIHWPNQVADWFRDMRRAASYSPVMARWVTIGDYFHLTDRPYDVLRPKIDEYTYPYLRQAVERGDPSPIARRARHVRLRTRLDALLSLRALGAALGVASEAPEGSENEFETLEHALETGALDGFEERLAARESAWVAEVARAVGRAANEREPQRGVLAVNPLSVPRRAPIPLPENAGLPQIEGPVLAAQWTDRGPEAMVHIPAFGYAWIPLEPSEQGASAPSGELHARGRVLHGETMRIEFDPGTGGLRAVMGPGEPSARLGQQLVAVGLDGDVDSDKPTGGKMIATHFEVEHGGPSFLQALSTGEVKEAASNRALARFRQRVRLWSGRPWAELEIELLDLDDAWLESIAQGPPWERFLACRWAWPDANATIRRALNANLKPSTADRMESSECVEISARRQHTALLFGGLAHHQRRGSRMLDTVLIAGRESARTFRIGIALDLEHPYRAAIDWLSPVHATTEPVPVPRTGPTGWFFRLDARSVAVTRVEPVSTEEDVPALAFHVLETAGKATRCRLRLFREPVSARQTDFNDERIVELTIDDDAVLLDLTPHEFGRVVVAFS